MSGAKQVIALVDKDGNYYEGATGAVGGLVEVRAGVDEILMPRSTTHG